MKLCILEDEKQHRELLLRMLQRWERENQHTLFIDSYTSGEELMEKEEWNYHVIFLDIQLEAMNGMETARMLRERGYQNDLVFLTAFREYVFEGYEVQALNYLLKPVEYGKLALCMGYLKEKIQDEYFVYRYRNEVAQIPFRKILYFSSSNHSTDIVTADRTYKQAEPFKSVRKRLPKQFIQCHRTIMVNMYHVMKLQGKEIFLTNREQLPVSVTYLQNIRNAFLRHLTLEGNGHSDSPSS